MKFRYPFLVLYFALAVQVGLAQNTYVPDDNFEQALIDLGYDDTLDDSVLTANISSLTSLNISNLSISDLTGIGGFTALTSLDCGTNQLSGLDVSANTSLTNLYCKANQLVTLDISNNTSLTVLECEENQLTSLDLIANTALTYLWCGSNQLTSLDVSANTTLEDLRCGNNQLTTLDVSANTALTYLTCSNNNQLTTLDVSANTALTNLYCHNNSLTSLDVSSNTALIRLECNNNELTSLDVSNNTALTELNCSFNQLTSLDVSSNTALTTLRCHFNQLTSLDVSANTSLTILDCYNNSLTSLDVSANTALTTLICHHNSLTSLDVSSNTALARLECNHNSLTSLDVSTNTALIWLSCFSNQLTSLDVSANTALRWLHCRYNQLTSLDVSTNTSLTYLNCEANQLTSLDVSSNTALGQLDCGNNQLTSLDVSSNTPLYQLVCGNNQLTSLDVSSNTALTLLYCQTNQLTSLDVSNNTALSNLRFSNNQLTSLNVSSNTALDILNCYSNQLTSLDVSSNTALTQLRFYSNQITEIDLSSNTALGNLECGSNQLTSLDVSSNTALTSLACQNNQLTYLNMKNGVTDQLTDFNATSNDSLECIETLDPDYATANWTLANGNIDAGVTFADICYASNPSYTYVPDDNFEQRLIDLGYDDTLDDYVLTANISGVTSLNVSNEGISSLTGIEGFTALTNLHCEVNELTSLDVGSNTALTDLSCGHNELTSLDVSNNTALTDLQCYSNQLTSLDVSTNTALSELHCQNNQLTSLDVSTNTALSELHCQNNQLTSLDVSSNTSLTTLDCDRNSLTTLDVGSALTSLLCRHNSLTSLDVSANTALTILACGHNSLTSLDVSANTALTNLTCPNNQLTSLDASSNTVLTRLDCDNNSLTNLDVGSALTSLYCSQNQLTSLDVSSNIVLINLECRDNQLTSLDLSANTALEVLHCYVNQLTSLDVSANTALTYLDCNNNQLTSLDVSNDTALTHLQCYDNQLTSLDVSSNTALTWLNCNANQLTSLDLSSNTALTWLNCNTNQLTYLNMKNGVTDQLTEFNAFLNSLTCIETLDPDYATANWAYANGNIDEGVTFDVICGAEARTHWYVDTTGSDASGSGTEASPLSSIQTAINATTDGDTVSVAAGTYVENLVFGGKNLSLIGADSSNTIIDGDSVSQVINLQNGEDSTTVIKNFTLRNGIGWQHNGSAILMGGGDYAGYPGPKLENLYITQNYDNAIMSFGSTFSLKNSRIVNNYNQGISLNYSQLSTLDNVIISGNQWSGVQITSSASPVFNNVTISNNVGEVGAGVQCYDQASPTFINCVISNNTASGSGGGIYSEDASLIIENSYINNNTSGYQGGGVYIQDGGDSRIINSFIENNTCTGYGGGLTFFRGNLELIGTVVSNNESTEDNGGGIFVDGGYVEIIESTLQSNTANGFGGGMFFHGSGYISRSRIVNNVSSVSGGGGLAFCCGAETEIYNTTIAENSAGNDEGNGIYSHCNAGVEIKNSILWNSGSEEIRIEDDCISNRGFNVEFSTIKGGEEGIVLNGISLEWGDGNITADPLLEGGHTLGAGSPAIDAGNPHAYFYDCDGTPNDMGNNGGCGTNVSATELDFGFVAVGDTKTETITVHSNKNYGGSTISTASFDDDQFSLNTSLPIEVEQYSKSQVEINFSPVSTGTQSGTMSLGNINPGFSGESGEFTLSGNAFDLSDGVVEVPAEVPTIQEAIDASSDRDTVLVSAGTYVENLIIDKEIAVIGADRETTIIDGDSSGSVVYFGSNAGMDTYFSGFTVQNGTGTYYGGYPVGYSGGGIYMVGQEAAPLLTNLIVQNNTATGGGAGISTESGANLRLANSIIRNNTSSGGGGGHGGGIRTAGGGESMVHNVEIYGNHSSGIGGGIEDSDGMIISNSIIRNNISEDGGDGLRGHDIKIFNCVIINNGSSESSGGSVLKLDSYAMVHNTIIWNNVHENIENGVDVSVSYSIISGGLGAFTNQNDIDWGTSNNSGDPLFADAANNDFSLSASSPAIDAGNPSAFYNDSDGSQNDMGYTGGNGIFIKKNTYDDTWNNDLTNIDFGYTGVNYGNVNGLRLRIFNTRTEDITLSSYSTTDDQFFVDFWYLENSTWPLVIPAMANTFSTAGYGMWCKYYPTTAGSHSATVTLYSDNIPGSGYGTLSMSGIALDIPAGDINVPADAPTIQAAIDIAPSGKTIVVAPGEYFENLRMSKRDVTLKSSTGPLETTINGGGIGSVFYGISHGTVIDGFTLTGGNGSGATGSISAINGYDGHRSIFKNLIITGNANGPVMQPLPCAIMENVLIADNTGSDAVLYYNGCAGEMADGLLNHVTIANNTNMDGILFHNQCGSSGSDYRLNIINSAIWGNQQGSIKILDDTYSTLDISYTLLEGGANGIYWDGDEVNANIEIGNGVITSYPYFNSPETGDFSLSAYSPMIGAGFDLDVVTLEITNTSDQSTYTTSTTDILGNARPNPSGTSPDIGAYESSESVADYNPHKYVATTGSNSDPGTLDMPYLTIQYAIDQAQNDDIIHVAAGTYVENINFDGTNITMIGDGPGISIIDGGANGYVVTFPELSGTPSYRLEGFTIQNGYAQNGYGWGDAGGGGINAETGNINLERLLIKDNVGSFAAAIWSSKSTITMNKLTVINNSNGASDDNSGTIYLNAGSDVSIVNCLITDNEFRPVFAFSANDANTVSVSYSVLDGGQDSIVTNDNLTINWGNGNFQTQQLGFIDSTNDNFNINATSHLINAGHPDSTDSDGSRADIGAYPYLNSYSGPTWYVSAADGNNTTATGASTAPFKSIQSAINFATTIGDSVTVAAGTYVESIDFRGRNIKVVGEDRETTIIDGNQSGSVVIFEYEFGGGVTAAAMLSGFTITNGGDVESGGGIRCKGNSNPTLNNLIVQNNTANNGGGISLESSNPTLSNVKISGNTASDGRGGGLRCISSSDPSLVNVIISGNTSSQEGGGVYNNASDPSFVNVTITGNLSSPTEGNGIFCMNNSNPNLVNTILWGNGPDELEFASYDGSNSITIFNSNIEGGQDSIVTNDNGTVIWGDGNIDADPMFVDTANGDYHLSDLSPAIGAATASITIDGVTYTAPTTDLDGNPRPNPAGTVPDMGAYESDKGVDPNYAGPVWYVDGPAGLPYGNGGPGAPFTTIQAGIDASSSGDTVSVKAGTYLENIDFSGKNIALLGEDRETTIIDGDSSGSVVTFSNGETPSAVLDGFTLTNGEANNGGGIFVDGTDPTLTNLIINNNTAVNNGGGIYISNSSLLLKNSIIKGNSSVWGGGIQIQNNSVPTILNVEITGNNPAYGSAVYIAGSDPVISNATITNNKSYYVNNNEKGIDLYHGANVTLTNSIITGQNYAPINFSGGDPSSITISYSLIEGGQDSIINNDNGTVTWGSGNIDVDPMFVDTANGNYHLLASSQLINAGHPDSTDADGTTADIGAYPYLNTYSGDNGWHVSNNGSDETGDGDGGAPFASIQAGINFAEDGDSVTVAAGTYVENVTFRGRNIKVVGEDRETTIIDGNQTGCVIRNVGGGEDVYVARFTITNGNGNFTNNSDPGGIYAQSGLYEDLIITSNTGGDGGGVLAGDPGSNKEFRNCVISNNEGNSGGGIYLVGNVGIYDCIISNNTSVGLGGGLYCIDNSSLEMLNTVVENNQNTDQTDGLYSYHSSSLSIINSVFKNNGYTGIRVEGNGSGQSLISNTLVYGHSMGIFSWGGDITIDRCTVVDNGNLGLNFYQDGTRNVTNSIIYNNGYANESAYNIYMGGAENAVLSISYSDIQGDSVFVQSGNLIWGSGNIDVDPMFVDTANGNYHLLASSQCINGGHPDSTDSDGSRADIGAYPYLNSYSGPTWYIAENGNDTTATGTSDDPFRSIQAGINFSSDADSVTVAAGTYVENVDFRGRNIKVVGENQETTIIDGDSLSSVVVFKNYHENGVDDLDDVLLKGFTLQNGVGSPEGVPAGELRFGGGILCEYASPVLRDLILRDNAVIATGYGAGIHLRYWSSPLIENIIIKNGSLSQNSDASAIYSYHYSNPVINNFLIEEHLGYGDGNGGRLMNIYDNCNVTFNSGVVHNNLGVMDFNTGCDVSFNNVLLNNNESNNLMVVHNSKAQFNAMTIWNNSATQEGIVLYDGSSLDIQNSIIDEHIHSADENTGVDTLSIIYSLYSGSQDSIFLMPNAVITWGEGNIDVDPMFVDTANGDYTLQMDSPLIDAGHPDSTDADGTIADIGAYYYDQSGQPARVQGFVTTPTDSSEIFLTWEAVAGNFSGSYKIYRSTDPDEDFYSASPVSSVTSTIWGDDLGVEDQTYYYRVSAMDSEGDEGLLALTEHARFGLDSTALHLQDAYLTHTTGLGLDAGSSYTLEAFVRFPAFPTDPINFIIFGNDFLQLVPLENDQARIDLHLSGTDHEGSTIADTSWHHVALTTDGSTSTLWVDGYASIIASAGFGVNDKVLKYGNSASTSLNIRIDEARLSNAVRYTSGFIPVAGFGVDASTLGYWAFDEGSTDDQTPATYDRSGNGLHLSIEHEGSDVVAWYAGVPVVDISTSPLVINEIMQNPSEVSDPQGEWIEIHNTYFTPLHLKDYVLSDDGSDAHTIATDVVVPAGGYAVLASNADTATNAGLDADYEYSSFSLGNSDDEVLLSDPNGTEIDRVAYDDGTTFPDPSGASMELIAPHYDNSLGNSWAAAVAEYGAGDLGSPGRRNDAFSGAIVLSDSTLNFGGVVEGGEVDETLYISNTGVRALTISAISSTLDEYTISLSSAALAIGDTLGLVITFTPTGPGLYQDTLLLVSDDPVQPTTSVPLSAFGISEAADITIASAESDSLAVFAFPLTRIGSPRTTTFSVSNIGAEALEIDEITFTGDTEGFTVNQSSLYLELYDTAWVDVTFDPPVNGPYAATLVMTSNDPDEALYNIAFTGTGSQYIIFEVPGEIPTIQAALDTALAGDTVNVAAGSYGGGLVFPANDLVLRGSGQETTILNGGDSSVVLTINSGQTAASVISGFTIRGGLGTNGGGVVVNNGASPVFDQIIFNNNAATQGAALYVNSFSGPTVNRSTFVVNSASSGQGGGIAVAGGSNVTVTSSIFWANTGTPIEVLSGGYNTTYSIVEGGDAGTGNLDQNPLFVNPGTGDFHIQWGSPAIDGGNPSSPQDPDGTAADMGALYYDQTFQPPNAPTGLSYTVAADHVILLWIANSEADLVNYTIYRGFSAQTLDSLTLVMAPNTAYEDFSIDPAIPLYYQVAAVDTADLISDRSPVIEVSYPVIAASSGAVDFGSVRFLQSVEQIIYFYNHGSLELNIDSIFVQDDVGFSASIGGLLLQTGSLGSGKTMLPIEPLNPGRGTGENDKDEPLSHNPGKEEDSEILSVSREGFNIIPGDSLEIAISFTSADTGSFTTNLVTQSDDPVTNVLSVPLAAHAVAPEIELVRTMSVVTYLNNDISFDVAVLNPGGYPLDYTVTAEANYFGFEWLTPVQSSGQVPGYSTGTLTVNVTNTANLDAAGYQGYLYFNTNASGDPDAMVPTDTIAVYMALLADGSQISAGIVTVPSGNAAPINVVDDTGADMGLMLDFINSSGGSITITRIDAHPPADSSTDFTDPSGTITDPEYARRYYEINATISGSFAVDIGFDYATLAGILDPAALRLAKRSLNAGTGEEWTIIPSASTTLNETDGLVVATNQTAFSQWTILSNEGENTFIDMQAPTVASTAVDPTEPGILEDVTVTATINDETGISTADLYYTSGGSAVFASTAMSGTGSSWSALIPGAEVSRNGIIYYVSATDPLNYSALSDTFGVAVTFPAGNLSTSSANGSGYAAGLPIDKWRLLAVPAVLTTATVAGVIGDELGAQSNSTWRIFRYNQASGTYTENPNNFTPGEAYWIYQRVEDNLVLTAPGGQTGNMSGTNLTIIPGWSLISSPYPFPIDAALNQTLFYGPITYGVSAESWTDIQTELIPWSGYALYNRTSNDQTVILDPIASTSGTLARTVQKEGWLMNLAVAAGVYADQFNQLGRIIGAEDGLDHFDNPELLPPGEYLSLAFALPEYGGKTTFTSDLRSPGTDAALWTANIRAKGLSETATLSWTQLQPLGGLEAVRIIDRQTRTVVDALSVSNLFLGRINERFPRVLDLVAGDPAQVEDLVKEILASLPEEFSLKQNYPNPFNPVTTIQFGLPQPANVRLTIVNILGQEVATLINDWRDMGFHQVRWAGVNDQGLPVSTGVYFSVLTDGQQVQIRKMLLVK